MTARELLDGALELLDEGWLAPSFADLAHGYTARRADGSGTWWGDPEATAWCMGGALRRAAQMPLGMAPDYPDGLVPEDEPWPHAEAYGAAVGALEERAGMTYGLYNDTHERAEVLALMSAARDALA